MKKILQLVTAIILIFTAVESQAQIVNGTLSNDWTFTDINGNTQNLYTYLNAGKTVVIDISAAWCGPCWAYHNSGNLDALWAAHGPTGGTGVSATTTNDMMVFLIEGELTNTSAQLHGITGSTGNAYADDTQGDWTLNTNYPIIDLSSSTLGASALLTGYNLHYFPTCIMICPDRTMTEVDQWTTAQLYTQKGLCSIGTTPADAQMMSSTSLNTSLNSCDSVTPSFRLGNIGTAALTSATITYQVDGVTQKIDNWTGNLASYGNATVTGIKLGSSTPGQHTISAMVSNPNGTTDPTPANNTTTLPFLIYSHTAGAPVSENFETSGIPSSWIVSNGGSSLSWMQGSTGYNSNSSATLGFYNIPSGIVNSLILPTMSFTNLTSPTLTFDVAYAQSSSTINDKLEVDISTNCGSSWLPRYNKYGAALATSTLTSSVFVPTFATQWRHETVDLTFYHGQADVLVRFKGTSANGNNVYVDNVNIAEATGINEYSNIASISVFPNPVANNATVNFNLTQQSNVTITLTNALGQEVLKTELGNLNGEQNYTLNTEKVNSGLYFLTIKAGNGSITKKIAVDK